MFRNKCIGLVKDGVFYSLRDTDSAPEILTEKIMRKLMKMMLSVKLDKFLGEVDDRKIYVKEVIDGAVVGLFDKEDIKNYKRYKNTNNKLKNAKREA